MSACDYLAFEKRRDIKKTRPSFCCTHEILPQNFNVNFSLRSMKSGNLIRLMKGLDARLFGAATILNATGLLILYSITSTADGDTRFWRQLLFIAIGVAAMFFVRSIDYQKIKGYVPLLYAATIISLILVLVIGDSIRGTRGWFTIFGFGIQPVEFAKIILCIIVAKIVSDQQSKLLSWRAILLASLLVGLPLTLVLLQPDTGSAIIIVLLTVGIMYAKGFTRQQFLIGAFAAVLLGTISWTFLLKPYQKERIEIFLGIRHDPYGVAYNVDQSIIAIGSGGITGQGIGRGSQSQLRYLPEAPTDFIFASAAEELGLIGSLVALSGFGFLIQRIFSIASETRDAFSSFLAYGIGSLFLAHITINLGAVLGLLPVMGVPLPFMSYGGSFLLTCWILLGILMSINRRNHIVY